MTIESYQNEIALAAEQLFNTNDLAAFQEDMINIVTVNLEQGFYDGADEVLPEEEYPPIVETLRSQQEPEKTLPESARIALLTLVALNIGYITSFGVFVLNKRGSVNSMLSGLNDAELYFNRGNTDSAVYSLLFAEQSAKGIGIPVVSAIKKIVTGITRGEYTTLSPVIKKVTETAYSVVAKNIVGKAGQWGNGYLNSMNMGRLLSAPDETPMKWNLGDRDHCKSCLKLDGKVKTAQYWRDEGIGPQAGPYGSLPNTLLECGGYRCGCYFTVTDDPLTPGNLPTLP